MHTFNKLHINRRACSKKKKKATAITNYEIQVIKIHLKKILTIWKMIFFFSFSVAIVLMNM